MIIDFTELGDTMLEKYKALFAMIKEQQQDASITDMIGGPELVSIFETDDDFIVDDNIDLHNHQSIGTWNGIRCWKMLFPLTNPLAKTLTFYISKNDGEVEVNTIALKNFLELGFTNEPTECTDNA